MVGNVRRAAAGRGLVLVPAAALLMLFVLPAAISQAWPGPGHPLDAIEQQVVDLVNKERESRNLKPYIVNFSLQEAAWKHTEHMAKNKVMCHQGCGDGDPAQRIKATGYQAATWGENVASGYQTAAEVMNGWMNSTGHRANILNKDFTDIGVAYADGGKYGTSWTQVFGIPRSGYATITPPAGGGGGVPTPGVCRLPGDVNGDKRVTTEDVNLVAGRLGARTGDARYAVDFDVRRDGVINVVDTFAVMMTLGQACAD
jgi:uncharacterized protein YkwD